MAIKTFATGEVLTASDTNTYLANSGLVYVTSTTVGSAVSSVTVSNCFSTTYDNYRITYAGGTATNADFIRLTLSGGSGTSYAYGATFIQYSNTTNTTVSAGDTAARVGVMGMTRWGMVIDIYSPFLSTQTNFTSQTSSDQYSWSGGGYNSTSASSTGFTLTPAAGTITGGIITVMGYRKA
jgi:cytochrome c biogenesis protein CcdA